MLKNCGNMIETEETTQLKQGRSVNCNHEFITHVQEDDNMSRNVLRVKCEGHDYYGRDEEPHSCIKLCQPETLRTVLHACKCLELQHNESLDMSPKYLVNLNAESGTHVLSQNYNTEPRMMKNEMSMDPIHFQESAVVVSKTQSDYNRTLPYESYLMEAHEIFPINESDEILDKDLSPKVESTEQVKNCRKLSDGNKYNVCGTGLTCQRNLKLHELEMCYKCDICGVGFSSCSNLKKHQRIHTGEKPYKRDVCGIGYTSSSKLKIHQRIHTGEKSYKCDFCGVGCTSCSKLKVHERIHTGEKPYKCDVCGVGCTTSSSLKVHHRIHTGEKPYKCDVCGVRCTSSSNLKAHQRIHTGEKPYKCDVCDVRCTCISNLKRHKRIHTGEKPYKCEVCGVGFSSSTMLKRHKRIHTGEKPYKCDICSTQFTDNSGLNRHKRIHTGEKPYNLLVTVI